MSLTIPQQLLVTLLVLGATVTLGTKWCVVFGVGIMLVLILSFWRRC